MKKIVVSLCILALVLLIVGCVNYKAYDVGNTTVTGDAVDGDIADIEKQLGDVDQDAAEVTETEVEGEVVMPNLEEEQPEIVNEEDLPVMTIKENQLARIKLKIYDPNKDMVNYTFSKPFSQKGEWQTSYGDAGEYVVTITATDGKLTTESKLKLVVERVNVAPVIEGVKDLIISEGATVKVEPIVKDPNHDAVTIEISDPLSSGVWVTDHTSAGEYDITVTASDGELKSEKHFALKVKDVNLAPEVSGLQDLTVKEGELVELKPVVTDIDQEGNETITIIYGAPIGKDGTWIPSYTSRGVYDVSVTVTDGRGAVVVQKVKITVEAVNMPPVIEDVTVEAR